MSRTGRPPIPESQRALRQTVRLEPVVFDAVSKEALRQGISNVALIRRVITRVFRCYKSRDGVPSWYGAPERLSTLTTLVVASPSPDVRDQSGR